MYTWEIEKFLVEHGRVITRDEFYKIINKVDNPQIKDIEYQGDYSGFVIKTSDGNNMDVIVKK